MQINKVFQLSDFNRNRTSKEISIEVNPANIFQITDFRWEVTGEPIARQIGVFQFP